MRPPSRNLNNHRNSAINEGEAIAVSPFFHRTFTELSPNYREISAIIIGYAYAHIKKVW